MQLIQVITGDQTNATLAGSAALIACAFSLCTYDRWHRHGHRHEWAWTIAMSLFAIGSLTLWLAETLGWTILIFKLFFLTGAILNVAWLALGTIYLLMGKKLGDQCAAWLIAFSAFAVGVISVAPTKAAIIPNEFPSGRDLFGVLPRILAAVGSGVPAMVILIGAVWSAVQVFRPSSTMRNKPTGRVVLSVGRLAFGNVLIATATLVLSGSGLFAARLGKDRAFAVTLLVGLAILFSGFLVASNSSRNQKHKSVT